LMFYSKYEGGGIMFRVYKKMVGGIDVYIK